MLHLFKCRSKLVGRIQSHWIPVRELGKEFPQHVRGLPSATSDHRMGPLIAAEMACLRGSAAIWLYYPQTKIQTQTACTWTKIQTHRSTAWTKIQTQTARGPIYKHRLRRPRYARHPTVARNKPPVQRRGHHSFSDVAAPHPLCWVV